MNLRFVLTGGPGAGKTTILEALAERGYQYVPDTARTIIEERLEAGLSPRPSLAQFGRDILQRDIIYYREMAVTDKPVFFDRGVVDTLCLLHLAEAISPAEVEGYIRQFPYNEVVFLLPPWESIYRTDAQRDQSARSVFHLGCGSPALYFTPRVSWITPLLLPCTPCALALSVARESW